MAFIDDMMKRFRGTQLFAVTLPRTTDKAAEPELSPEASYPRQADPAGREALHRSVQERSYYLWKEAGEPEGRADEFWRRSLDDHLSQRAQEIWEREGHPAGRENEHWYQACRDLERVGLKS